MGVLASVICQLCHRRLLATRWVTWPAWLFPESISASELAGLRTLLRSAPASENDARDSRGAMSDLSLLLGASAHC